MCNEGDADSPDCRAIVVSCGINTDGKVDAFSTSTPPLEAIRLIVSYAATHALDGRRRMVKISGVRTAMSTSSFPSRIQTTAEGYYENPNFAYTALAMKRKGGSKPLAFI